MPTPQIAKWVSVDLVCLAQNTGAMTTFQYESSASSMTETEALDFATAWMTRMTSYIQAVMNSQVALNLIRVTSHFPGDANVQVEKNFPVGTFGTGSGDPLPNNAACVVKYLTGHTGRSKRGRQYFFGAGESNATGNSFASTYLSGISLLVAQHLAGFTVDGINFRAAIPSRKLLALNDVTSSVVNSLVRTQRRRLPRNSIFAY